MGMKNKLFIFFSILGLLLSTLFVNIPSQIVFAQENTFDITEHSVNVADINKYNYIDIYSNNITLLSTELNTISYITQSTTNTFNSVGVNDGQIMMPKFAKKINNHIAIYDSLKRLQIFDSEFNFTKRFAYIQDDNLPLNLGEIVSISTDYSGNLFMLDKTNNLILKVGLNDDIINKIDINKEITIADNSKICVNANGDKIVLINTNESNLIYNTNTQTCSEIDNNIYDDCLFDCMDNLFLLKKDTTTSISKYNINDITAPVTETLNLTYNSIDIDIETGSVYILSDKVYKVTNDNYFSNASTEISPVDITSTLAHETALVVCNTKNNAKLYSTCVSFSSSIVLSNNTKVIVLQAQMPQNKNMSYCLLTANGQELKGYIETSNLTTINTQTNELQYKTICKNVDILSYPSQNAGIVKTLTDEATTINIIGNTGDYVDINGDRYFEAKVEDKIAYVNQKYLAKTNLAEIEKIETTPTETNQSQFVALVLTVVCLFVVTIFVCVVINKKYKNQN